MKNIFRSLLERRALKIMSNSQKLNKYMKELIVVNNLEEEYNEKLKKFQSQANELTNLRLEVLRRKNEMKQTIRQF